MPKLGASWIESDDSDGVWTVEPGSGRLNLDQSQLQIGGTDVDITAAEANQLDGLAASAGLVLAREFTFTEAGGTTYTATCAIPAGGWVLNIIVENIALWDDGTSAALIVGDDDDPDGYFQSTNVKATDLTAGQQIDFNAAGGKGGAYITEGTSTHTLARYYAAANNVIGKITTGGQNGTAGRTRMIVFYVVPTSTTAATEA